MDSRKIFTVMISLIVALGGFLLGFDSAVISGATPFYKVALNISNAWLIGFSVSSIIGGAMLGNFVAGPLADKYGRKLMLIVTAFLFLFCALGTAFAQEIIFFIVARIVGGVGVGMAIIVAPMYIGEIAPRKMRGTLVTFNQLNIVLGISIAYFTNYYLLHLGLSDAVVWRWMLGVGAIPAIAYFLLLFFVPNSPRWLINVGRDAEALEVLKKINEDDVALEEFNQIKKHIATGKTEEGKSSFVEVFSKKMTTILIIGFGIAFFQQITGINAIFYYAPMIFELTGGGKEAAFMQAVYLGLTNVVMTVVAMFLIDKLGRRPLLIIGSIGITLSLLLAGITFKNATYTLTPGKIETLKTEAAANKEISAELAATLNNLSTVTDKEYTSETLFFDDVESALGEAGYLQFKDSITKEAIHINSLWVLIGLILYVSSFAISLGPVMWALLSEIFPNKIRGLAFSIVGFWNSVVSFGVASIFPSELEWFGAGTTFLIYALFGFLTLLFVLKFVPETKGQSLEELEDTLVMRH